MNPVQRYIMYPQTSLNSKYMKIDKKNILYKFECIKESEVYCLVCEKENYIILSDHILRYGLSLTC